MTTLEMLRLEVLGSKTDNSKDDLLNLKLEEAKAIFNLIKYPYDYEEMILTSIPREYQHWQVMCAKELYNKYGNEGVNTYSENGLSISYSDISKLISPSLISLLTPKAGVPQ